MTLLAAGRIGTKKHRAVGSEGTAQENLIVFPRGLGLAQAGLSPRHDPDGMERRDRISPGLTGVSETMLWALHNRASEARKSEGVLSDLACVRIHESIDYDFTGHFGDPLGFLAARAAEIDRALRAWLERHPDGCVVSLGEGLETQSRRVDNGRMQWLSVDLPEAIRLRERFLAPTHRFRHIATSALDTAWMDAVDPSSGVFIVAQGLLMYLEPERVRRLFISVAGRFPGTDIVFDTVPCWFSRLTLLGLNQTMRYRLPPMPWGIDRDEIAPTLRNWHPTIAGIEFLDHRAPRGLPRLLADITDHIPFARHGIPSLVQVTIDDADSRSAACASRVAGAIPLPSNLAQNGLLRSDKPTVRKPEMSVQSSHVSHTEKLGGVLTVAARNARHGGDIARATGQVIAKRVALGVAAAFNPRQADHAEFARMIPEKVEAFSSAGVAVLEQTSEASRQMIRLASDEVMTATRATIELIGCSGPAALAEAQGRFARAWFRRQAANVMALSALALATQAASMAPIRSTVVANAERLGR